MTDPLEQRYAVKFCVLLGKNTVETNEMIKQAFKDKALSESSVRKWHKMFRDGREEVTDEARCIKSKLKGKHWGTIKDIQEATTRALKDLPVDVFQGAFRAWKTRLQKCIDAEGYACLYKRGPQPGYIFLFDMQGVKLGHLTRVSLSFQKEKQRSLRKFFTYIQEALPVRMKEIHVLNTEPILDKLLLLIRPFMDKKFFDMIKFHHKDENLENFYETVIPRSALPPDYGGTLSDTQTLHKKCMQYLQTIEPYFVAEEAQRHVAIAFKKGEKGLERNFKKLDID
ncbi:uncharacterized protein LOC113225465 [Hyposmocoma kahamanoa]|uniref:uncharacterized protein LOC113225465 n=1 Tax=Hyposmocoma kahamanoa TaxID=1477025 RepID=UPI000E6D8299|nr:uncharacterized protein LOC113225465 [Hyposmocoma kahamanoa]